jgi:glycosyltransferase involved in cell wall biosynthesis
MAGKPELSIVVTLLNEERTVEELYARTVAAVNGRPFEVVFVDDGSTDGTYDVLRRLHDRDPRVRAVRFSRNFGQHPAMHAGFVRARGDILVTMDGDLQNQPEDIPKLVAAVEGGADVASGRRATRRDSWGRTLPSRLINGMLRRFTASRSPTSAARSTRTAAARSSRCSDRSGGRSSRRHSSSPAGRASSRSTSPTSRARDGRATRRYA